MLSLACGIHILLREVVLFLNMYVLNCGMQVSFLFFLLLTITTCLICQAICKDVGCQNEHTKTGLLGFHALLDQHVSLLSDDYIFLGL